MNLEISNIFSIVASFAFLKGGRHVKLKCYLLSALILIIIFGLPFSESYLYFTFGWPAAGIVVINTTLAAYLYLKFANPVKK